MVSSKHGAHLSMRDVQELATASEQLAAAAGVIRRVNPAWGEGVVNLLIAANQVVVRIQEKGAGAFGRYLSKRGLKMPDAAPAEPAPSDAVAGERSTPENEEEG